MRKTEDEHPSASLERPSKSAQAHRRLQTNSSIPATVSAALDAPGEALDSDTRVFFESAFDRDFSHVLIHRNGTAERSARSLNAAAYTLGHHIVFGAGRYAPREAQGRRLLAHELAHVVQYDQARGTSLANVPVLSRKPETANAEGSASNSASSLDPLPLHCGPYEDWVRWFLLIEPTVWSDLVTCGCFVASSIDIVSGDPVFENLDCLCNLLTFVQILYNLGADGGCWSWNKATALDAGRAGAFLGATLIDCASTQLGVLLGGATGLTSGATAGGTGGSAAGPAGTTGGVLGGGISGAVFGAWLGSVVVDVAAAAAQNLAQQGTVLPEAQLTACNRTWLRLSSQLGL